MTPETSTTLLRDLAADVNHPRWATFIERYRPMMEGYMRERFPRLDAEEIIEETFVALVGILPNYRYDPKLNGAFHNYLTGVLRRKALKAVEREKRYAGRLERYAGRMTESESDDEAEFEAYREAIFEIALRELLADDSIHGRNREIFRRVAVNGESPEAVAAAFGMKRNAVDQVKSRMTAKLRELVKALELSEGKCGADE